MNIILEERGTHFDPQLVDVAADHLDSVWQGFRCKNCKRKDFCGDRIG